MPAGTGRVPFVGRERELATLLECLEAVRQGQGGVVLIAGEPGIGKTRLAEELAAVARARGMRVAWGRCWQGEGAPAFGPWLQVLRACLVTREPADLWDVLGAGEPWIERVQQEQSRLDARPPLSPQPSFP